VVVEAKFGAALTSEQVHAYLTDQECRLEGGVQGALILLVPSYRRPEAETLLGTLRGRAGEHNAPTASVSTAVDTWEEWLRVLDEAAQELPAHEQDAVRCDLGQLRELCATMRGLDVPPLGLAATGRDFHDREPDLRRLVDEATIGFRTPWGQLLPLGNEPKFGFYRRYISGGLTEDPDCCCAVGVVGGLAEEGRPPFWLRYHKNTSSFQTVADRIMKSQYAADARDNGGHIWLPLRVSNDRSGAAIVDELTGKIDDIRAVAAG